MKNLNIMKLATLAVCVGAVSTACSGIDERNPEAAVESTPAAENTGSVSLNVTGFDTDGNPYNIDYIDITVTDGGGAVDVSLPGADVRGAGSSRSFAFELEEGTGYTLTATGMGTGSVDTTGDGVADPVITPCTSTATFDVVDDVVTPVTLTFDCRVPGEDVATGSAAVTADFTWERNAECGVTTLFAGPTTAFVGGVVNLTSAATAGATFAWTASDPTAGVFSAPSSPAGTFTCNLAGDVTLTLTITNEAELCEDSVNVPVTCISDYVCGDNVQDPGEQCDGTATPPGEECVDCRLVVCGDGVAQGTEVCDDGNTVSEDGCTADCSAVESCGDGVVQAGLGELCDPPGSAVPGGVCEADCTYAVASCGDCTADSCGAQQTACSDAANGTKCTDVMACFETSNCAVGATLDAATIVQPCFCGTFSALDCAGGEADGPCLASARLAASTTANPTTVLNTLVRFDDVAFAIGDVKQLALCQIGNCNFSCDQY